jgi:hypothetical protein
MLAHLTGIGGVALVSAQQERPLPAHLADSSARAILAHTRSNPVAIAGILRQQSRNQPRPKLDELADSLVAMALRNPSALDSGRFVNMTSALNAAGGRNGSGTPYAGALDRLIRIHQEYPSQLPGHSGVVEAMLSLADHDRAVEYVFRVATSTDQSAPYAMAALLYDVRNRGRFTGSTDAEREALRGRLRALWDRVKDEPYLPGGGPGRGVGRPSIPDAKALSNLLVFARDEGWSR